MKVGDYARTTEGEIIKVISYDEQPNNPLFEVINGVAIMKGTIIKSSSNIIDLIEVGDYVNGHLVKNRRASCNENLCGHPKQIDIGENEECKWIAEKDIKSIVTKQQFEEMEYKL